MSDTKRIFLDDEQEYALNTMLNGRNVCLSGKAGTGKTTVIREFEKRCNREIVLLAPTGLAATNICGSTIHRFFGFPIGVLTLEKLQQMELSEQRIEMLRVVDTIVLDEVSMVRSDVFVAMDKILRYVNRTDLPFGGKQLILVGDFAQLPPVIGKEEIKEFLATEFGGSFCWQTKAWNAANFEKIFLTKIYRQNEQEFLNIVNAIRANTNQASSRALDSLNKNCYIGGTPRTQDAIRLCCTKREAQIINEQAIGKLPAPGVIYPAECIGNFPDDELPVSKMLLVKKGARMLVVANKPNDDGTYEYINGDFGTVEDCQSGSSPSGNANA